MDKSQQRWARTDILPGFLGNRAPCFILYKKSHVQMKKTIIKGKRDRIWIKATCEESLKRRSGGVWAEKDEITTGAKLSSAL